MACDCFEQAKVKVREATGDPLAKIRGVLAPVNGKWCLLPSIEILYRKKKKDGSFTAKEFSMEMTYSYCPFCGKKLIEDEEKEG